MNALQVTENIGYLKKISSQIDEDYNYTKKESEKDILRKMSSKVNDLIFDLADYNEKRNK